MQLLLPEAGLLFWMLLSFSIVFLILKKYAFPFILKKEEDRREFIEQSLRNAQEANEKLENIRKQASEILHNAQTQRKELLSKTQKECEEILLNAKENAERASAEYMQEVKALFSEERKKVIQELQGEITSYVVVLTEQLLKKQLSNQEEQRNLIGKMIREQSFEKFNSRSNFN
ncbi:MAG TPA: ATP synthase F0 subunit B [Porphyromonadaceae bacterium]|nr:ATP synthase F0 subunit B [Porphyromonadaceae bacterium]